MMRACVLFPLFLWLIAQRTALWFQNPRTGFRKLISIPVPSPFPSSYIKVAILISFIMILFLFEKYKQYTYIYIPPFLHKR